MDETSQKIVDAAMTLIRDKGYVATTTKEIARVAGVNECTLFRKFKNKKDIVLQGVNQSQWRANVTPEIFEDVKWDLQADIEMFMRAYMDRMTPDFVNLMKAMVFGMNCRGIIIFLALFYQPKKNTSLSAYGGSDTNAIYRNINGQFTSRFSQAEN